MPRPSRDEVAALNDRLAREHPIDDYYAHSALPIRLVTRRRLGIIREFIGTSAGLELCEVGSGGGHVLALFPDARLTALDVSDVYLDVARKNLAGYDVHFVKGEVETLGLPASSFDRVVCTEVLEHTFDPEGILIAIGRLLRPDGVAVITIPNDPLILRLKALVRHTPVGWFLRGRIDWGGDAYHLHHWTPAEFRDLLARHFQITAFRAAPSRLLPLHACYRCVRRA